MFFHRLLQVALSVGHLASLYNYDMEQYDKVSWFLSMVTVTVIVMSSMTR